MAILLAHLQQPSHLYLANRLCSQSYHLSTSSQIQILGIKL